MKMTDDLARAVREAAKDLMSSDAPESIIEDYSVTILARVGPLFEVQQEELNCLKISGEEGSELLAEATAAIAGMAGELLKPCVSSCQGHFGPKAAKLFRDGLDAYAALAEEER